MKLPRIKILAKTVTLEILRAYNREIKSGTPEERTKGQSEAFSEAEKRISAIVSYATEKGPYTTSGLKEWMEQIIDE